MPEIVVFTPTQSPNRA